MTHEIDMNKADSALTVEWFLPEGTDDHYVVLLLDYERMPTYKKYQWGAMAHLDSNITKWNSKGGKVFLSFFSFIFDWRKLR